MGKIKLTKGELKRQRDSLVQFRHYLPTLQLKKRQLQTKILEINRLLIEKQKEIHQKEKEMQAWIGLLHDPELKKVKALNDHSNKEKAFEGLAAWVVPLKENVLIKTVNIAGATIPLLEDVRYPEIDLDYYEAPFWLLRGILELREYFTLYIDFYIIEAQLKVLKQELRVTTQRVNLFEKVKIPECLENIRRIRIYLGDQQANAVGISKVAKKKIEAVNMSELIAV